VKEAALQIAEVADRMVGWDSCFCDLYLAEQNVIQHVLSIDVVEGRKTQCPAVNDQKPPTAFASRAIREGGFLLLRDSSQSMRPDGIPFGDLSRASASILFVPIRNSQRVIGILSIQSYQLNAYDEVSLEMLQALADHCGGALDRIKSQETLVATQEQLRQAQKMEAIGQLAGGIAHDFNNLLAVIRGNTDLVVIEGKAFSPRITEFLGQIVKATERAATLARQLLTFSRKQVMQVQPLCLNDLVANLTKMIKRLISAEIDLQCRFQDGLPSVNADPSMIEQVVMNLAVNARDAMPQGGRLEILTRVACLDSTFKPGRIDARAGEFVSLRVSDTGTGVAPEHLPHLFEPFFTTKGAGKGTGLGLATVYGIIKQHHGWIEVSSQVGTGTTFEIFLPAVQAARQGAIQRPVETQFALGTETILLVDDESAVRLVTRRVLENQGYRVLEAASGSEALRLWDTLQRKADLLFTDVIMPDGINGRKLADELRAKKPDLSVVYASGYTGEVLGADTEWVHQNEGFFLQKPFTRADLLQTLRRSLDTQGRGTVTATGS
jgi:signal transduction histidine kinase/ActR/RegA family two-component response regulator